MKIDFYLPARRQTRPRTTAGMFASILWKGKKIHEVTFYVKVALISHA